MSSQNLTPRQREFMKQLEGAQPVQRQASALDVYRQNLLTVSITLASQAERIHPSERVDTLVLRAVAIAKGLIIQAATAPLPGELEQ